MIREPEDLPENKSFFAVNGPIVSRGGNKEDKVNQGAILRTFERS